MAAPVIDPPHTTDGPDTDTTTDASPTADTPTALLDAVGHLGDQLGRTMHALHRARAQLAAAGGDGVTEWSSRVALAKIALTGPKRVSELAELVHADASTVSRQVAAMVKEGLLERQADPGDGRASLLVATDRGRAAMAEFRAGRARDLAVALSAWSVTDLRSFATYLDRFAEDIGEHTTQAAGRVSPLGTPTGSSGRARSEGEQTS